MAGQSSRRSFLPSRPKEFAVRVLLSILAVVVLLPVLLVVGIALGPAALVLLFIAGIALVTAGLLRLAGRAMH